MEDTKTEVLEQYDFQVNNSYRGRDARILDTDQGLLSLREYSGSQRKLQFQDSLLEHLRGEGFLADFIVKNKEGGLTSKDREERPFVVRVWYEGKECSLREEAQVKKRWNAWPAAPVLPGHRTAGGGGGGGFCAGRFRHSGAAQPGNAKNSLLCAEPPRGKTDFEAAFLQCYPEFYEKGARAAEALAQSAYGNLYARAVQEGRVCHGSFHQHNVLFSGGKTVLLQFDRCHVGVQLSDLYDFMRKVMEKWDWNPRIGLQMLSWYDGVVPLSDDEREYVRLRLSYPEKFWKITNHYYNSREILDPRPDEGEAGHSHPAGKEKRGFPETNGLDIMITRKPDETPQAVF